MSLDGIELRLQELLAPLAIDLRVSHFQSSGPIIFGGPEFPSAVDYAGGALAETPGSVLVVGQVRTDQ